MVITGLGLGHPRGRGLSGVVGAELTIGEGAELAWGEEGGAAAFSASSCTKGQLMLSCLLAHMQQCILFYTCNIYALNSLYKINFYLKNIQESFKQL